MVKFGDHWTVNGFGETSIDLEGIVIVLNGSQPLAIGVLWYRTITQVYTACNFFLLPRRWLFLRAEKIRKNIVEIKKGGKCKRIVTTVPCHNLLWRQDLNMSDLNLPKWVVHSHILLHCRSRILAQYILKHTLPTPDFWNVLEHLNLATKRKMCAIAEQGRGRTFPTSRPHPLLCGFQQILED